MPIPSRRSSRQTIFALRFPAALMAVCLAACAPQIELHGNAPDTSAVKQIVVGQSTKSDVTTLLGSPSSIATFDPDIWYYISRRVKREAFLDPKLLEQKVYVVEFDDQGLVKKIHLDHNDAHHIAMNARVTPAPGKELTFVEQLLGNFGRFSGHSAAPDDSGGDSGDSGGDSGGGGNGGDEAPPP